MIFSFDELKAQKYNPSEYKEFQITIEKIKDGVKLYSSKGSAWQELTFTHNGRSEQAVDEYGMADLQDLKSEKDPNLTDYLFIVKKTKEGFHIKGLSGTAWKELNFSINQNQKKSFNQLGMVDLSNMEL